MNIAQSEVKKPSIKLKSFSLDKMRHTVFCSFDIKITKVFQNLETTASDVNVRHSR